MARAAQYPPNITPMERTNSKKRGHAEDTLGVTLVPADEETCARFMVLHGFVVTGVNEKGREKGIEPGDLVPGYDNYFNEIFWKDDDIGEVSCDVWLRPPK